MRVELEEVGSVARSRVPYESVIGKNFNLIRRSGEGVQPVTSISAGFGVVLGLRRSVGFLQVDEQE